MTVYGLTAAGFVPMTLADIAEEMRADYHALYGANFDLDERSPDGMQVALYAEREASVWALLQAAADALDPDNAEDAQLDSLSALTGTRRRSATYSTMTVTCVGTAGTVLEAGRVVSVAGSGARFASSAEATIPGGGEVDVTFTAEDTGPIPAAAGALTIETPVSGWDSAHNDNDATEGRDVENNDDLRIRREDELHGAAGPATEALRNRLLLVPGVTGALVFENTDMVADEAGRPPKCVEAVVAVIDGFTDFASIREALFGTSEDPRGAAGGIQIYGSSTGIVTDSNGFEHAVDYSPAEVVEVYTRAELTIDANEFPDDGEDQAELAFLAYQSELVMGKDVVGRAIGARIFRIPGVIDCVVTVGTTPTPASASVAIGVRQIAELASARLTLVVTAGSL